MDSVERLHDGGLLLAGGGSVSIGNPIIATRKGVGISVTSKKSPNFKKKAQKISIER